MTTSQGPAATSTGEQNKASKVKHAFFDLNRKFEERSVEALARGHQLPYFDLTGFPIDQNTLDLMSEEDAVSVSAIPFFRDGSVVKIGAVSPQNQDLQRIIREMTAKHLQPEILLVSQSGFDEAMKQYRKIVTVRTPQSHEIPVTIGSAVLEELKDLAKFDGRITEMPMTDLLGVIIGGAVTMRSSDIHFEPEKSFVKVRFRVDGVLTDMMALPKILLQPLLSRIKLVSGLKLNVTAVPQDGRFTVKANGKNLDMRVSIIPSAFGESVAVRLLGMQEVGFQIEELGLKGLALELVKKQLVKPNGMTLTTGPTGSGKTTTLYSFLNYLNEPGVKIVTLEDPVEYELEGITQTPIDHRAGMDFARGLRSVLRQDPDIVMVGEIRDFETVETAAQAALTGHVVLSTLHTNDAAGAIPRMLDLGVKPVTLAPALNTLIAQRLVRRLCQYCRKPHNLTHEEVQHVQMVLDSIPKVAEVALPKRLQFFESHGCEKCHNIGYFGRIGVFEVFAVNDKIQELIFKQASTLDIKRAAVASGMVTMQQDAVLKALDGQTDLAEVWRVTEE